MLLAGDGRAWFFDRYAGDDMGRLQAIVAEDVSLRLLLRQAKWGRSVVLTLLLSACAATPAVKIVSPPAATLSPRTVKQASPAEKSVQPGQANAPVKLDLTLAPQELGGSISVHQHMKVERIGRTDELDFALEINPVRLEMIGLAFGQRVLSLSYDGEELTWWAHPMVPAELHAEDVLSDMQLTLWPLESVRRALPPGWWIEDQPLRRILYMNDDIVTEISYTAMPRWSGTVVLNNRRFHYRLTVQAAPAAPE